MTTIAYKDGIMACDSCWAAGGVLISRATKIERTPHLMMGFAGGADSRSIAALLRDVKSPRDLPSQEALHRLGTIGQDARALVVFTTSGRIFVIDVDAPSSKRGAQGGLWEISFPYFAVGSGQDWARAAMALGKTAIEAVEFACEYDVHSSPPVYSMDRFVNVSVPPSKKPKR
jgi:hypothetical protein